MEDEKIVELYLLRNEEALGASKEKYGRMLLGLSQALLWNREDSEEDFKDDQKDAGELGAGHCVTVFYELKLRERTEESAELPFAELAIRWKEPGETKSKEKSFTLGQELYTENPDEDFLFATAVVECSALLRDSAYKGNASFENIQARLAKLNLEKDFYKEQFAQLLDTLIKNSSPNEKFAAI